ncbi:GGDEF domain-containing protein [Oxalobacteraceae bacterium]|nr:GGDEF domain-containing protein [Oxalobacteraceae bacterium]
MLRLHRIPFCAAMLSLPACFLLYAWMGTAKPLHLWRWMDIVSEGGTALMAGVWLLFTLSSRPGGLVTRLLGGGLAAIMLGSWADCLDEFFRIAKDQVWDNWLEALVPLGMLLLTVGMYYWRLEQFRVNEHLHKRERLFRDHQGFDRITQLAKADYLREQLRVEVARKPRGGSALVLFDIDGFHLINREFGQQEGDRVLQAVGHMLLLNLRSEDLLCRYAGDRFGLLLPGRDETEANTLAEHLCSMVAQMRHGAPQGRVPVTVRFVSAVLDGDPEALLARLSLALEGPAGLVKTQGKELGSDPAGQTPGLRRGFLHQNGAHTGMEFSYAEARAETACT